MKFDAVQQSIEEFVIANWTHTALQFENVPFNSDIYDEYTRVNVVYGDSVQRSVTAGCYRVPGLIMFSIFEKPATGSARMLELATLAANLLVSKMIYPVPPLDSPVVKMHVPMLHKEYRETGGWVFMQVSCPFYYDLEI